MSEQPIFGITNIPQDIKLELNNGTLTLKAGSKVYIDNEPYTLSSDSSSFPGSFNVPVVVFFERNRNGLIYFLPTQCGSGDSLPDASSTSYQIFFNTSDKIVYRKSLSNWIKTPGYSLPIALVSREGGSVKSIDQVFNGFGYIGSSIFVLPDVEGYYPNGKDGFLIKYGTRTTNSVLIYNNTDAHTKTPIAFSATVYNWGYGYEVVDSLPDVSQMTIWKRYYVKVDNKLYYTSNGSSITKGNEIPFGYFSTESSSPYRILSLDIVNPFITADLYDYEYSSSKPLSQYANSERYMGLFNNLCYLFNNSKTLEDWYRVVFNLKTASGYGLDIWGVILNQGRQISYEENGTIVNIFLGGEQTIDGITYSADYIEDIYRMVLFLKALGYITNCTLASLNSLLQFYFEKRVYVINYGTMAIRYVFEFYASKLEKAIFTTNILPRPTGVLANFEYIPLGEYFGFFVDGLAQPTDQPFAPFDQKPFYR